MGQPDQITPHRPYYEIRLKGHLDSAWTDWLEGLQVKLLENGETVAGGEQCLSCQILLQCCQPARGLDLVSDILRQ